MVLVVEMILVLAAELMMAPVVEMTIDLVDTTMTELIDESPTDLVVLTMDLVEKTTPVAMMDGFADEVVAWSDLRNDLDQPTGTVPYLVSFLDEPHPLDCYGATVPLCTSRPCPTRCRRLVGGSSSLLPVPGISKPHNVVDPRLPPLRFVGRRRK